MKRKNPAWLKTAVVYEIYPQTFNDTNGDGIGDIQGIIEKLDYIKNLGCNAIWLNPCFESPFRDAGYDVTDFYKVAPRYGTNDDIKRLFELAAKKGIKIILDLVAGHTSLENKWFQASCKDEPNKYSDWFIWTQNWGDCGGNSGYKFINGYGERNGSFMINFFYSQPALNYGFTEPDPSKPWQLSVDHPACKAVRKELKNIMKFWLDMGAAGFRVDMASSLVKGGPEDKRYKLLCDLWQDYRAWLDKDYPDAVLVSEWSDPTKAVPAGFHIDFLVHFNNSAYTRFFRQEKYRVGNSPFPDGPSVFDKAGKGDVKAAADDLMKNYLPIKDLGYMSVPTGNHDIGRIRQGRSDEELKVAFAMIYTMPGVPFIYYGDEIGMDYVEGLTTKEGGYNRTGARTPMQWDNAKANAGFSTAKASELYLPIDPSKKRPAVASQEKDKNSLLNFTRAILKLRNSSKALSADGELSILYAEHNKYPLVYLRSSGNERYVIAVNPSGQKASAAFALEKIKSFESAFSQGATLKIENGSCVVDMKPASFIIAKVK